jgi:5'-3' exonuclease
MIALIDADSMFYKAFYLVLHSEKEFWNIEKRKGKYFIGNPEVIRHFLTITEGSYSERKSLIESYMLELAIDRYYKLEQSIKETIEKAGIMITSEEYFVTKCTNSIRKNISADYKAKRKRNKYIPMLRNHLLQDGIYQVDEQYEADDLLADRAKELNEQGKEYIVISIDKDLQQIPGYHFNYYTETIKNDDGTTDKEMRGLSFTTPEQSWKMLAFQVLAGDSIDGVKGIPGIGSVKANNYLAGAKTFKELTNRVVRAYVQNQNKFPDNDWRSALYMNYRLIYLGRT